jgi:hypothetical protein
VDQVTAAAVGALNLLLLLSGRQYLMWWSWLGRRLTVAILALVATCGIVVGLLSSAAVHAAGWHGASSPALQGGAAALLGAALLRADVGTAPLSAPRSLAGRAASRLVEVAAALCKVRARDWALTLSSNALLAAVGAAPARPEARRGRQSDVDAICAALGGNPASRARAKGQLAHYIAKAYIDGRDTRPSVNPETL